MSLELKTLERVFEGRGVEWDCAIGYGEPGYTVGEGKKGILFADWNKFSKRELKIIEKKYEIEWKDEWVVIDGEAYRTTHDSYHWQPSIVWVEGDYVPVKELVRDEGYLEEEFMNSPKRAINFRDEGYRETLEGMGFREGEETYRNGLHQGMDDDPEKIYERLKDRCDVIFEVSEVSQFYISFRAWAREKGEGREVGNEGL